MLDVLRCLSVLSISCRCVLDTSPPIRHCTNSELCAMRLGSAAYLSTACHYAIFRCIYCVVCSVSMLIKTWNITSRGFLGGTWQVNTAFMVRCQRGRYVTPAMKKTYHYIHSEEVHTQHQVKLPMTLLADAAIALICLMCIYLASLIMALKLDDRWL